MSQRPRRTAFFISDGTGITAETLGNALLAQFDSIEFDRVILPYVDTAEQAREVVGRIDAAAAQDGAAPIIFDTIVNADLRKIIAGSRGELVDIFGTFLVPLERALGIPSSYAVGRSQISLDDPQYKARINAVNFAMENDDGGKTRQYDQAEVILVGVSRSGKTPTSLYLALQFGILVANYPLTEEDLGELTLPKALTLHKHKLFGLTIEPQRLAAIREQRKPGSRYASVKQCEFELREVEALFRRHGIPFLDTTHRSIEEISTRILVETGVERRVK